MQGASVISPGAQINGKSCVLTWVLTWPLDLINRGSFITITTIILSTNANFFFVYFFLFYGDISWRGRKLDWHWVILCHCVGWLAPGCVVVKQNAPIFSLLSWFLLQQTRGLMGFRRQRLTIDKPDVIMTIGQCFKQSVEIELLASYTTPDSTITKRQTGKKKNVSLSSPAVVTGGNS